MNIQDIYDLANKKFNIVIMPRGYGKNKFFAERNNKMEFTQQVKLTKEESNILHDVHKKLQMINCLGVRCPYCPLYIKENSPSCLNNIIGDILNKYGYKEFGND